MPVKKKVKSYALDRAISELPLVVSSRNKAKKASEIDENVKGLPATQPGPQTTFVNCDADIIIFGGAAGGAKTWGLLLDFAKEEYVENPEYSAVIFRRTSPQITAPGGLANEAEKIFPLVGGVGKQNGQEWRFPSGSRIDFRHLQHEKDKFSWQGAQITRIGMDEIAHFTESQFFYLMSRNRSTSGIKPCIRGTCNPDADSWLITGKNGWGSGLLGWWIDPETGLPINERGGVIRWFVRISDEIKWFDSKEDALHAYPEMLPKSFTFIPSKLSDNKILLEKDPCYKANLMAQDAIESARLLGGNWLVNYASGVVINKTWIEIVEELPDFNRVRQIYCCRFFDMAATAKEVNDSACYTASVFMYLIMPYDSNEFYYLIADATWDQLSPTDGDNLIVNQGYQDSKFNRGRAYALRWELEGGSSGLKVEANLKSRLSGVDAEGIRPMGDKLTRMKPFAATCKPITDPDSGEFISNGRVKVLNADFTPQFLAFLHAFDGTKKDGSDVCDAVSGCHTYLSQFDQVNALGWLSSV
ncbi:MAG: terminase family protein [Nodosilinea sp. WJT8-NPBG4]|jgi:phage terminase large subunit-like protein|nr:terminase family protein [Nodosilinea sp. WJT8-NPBG4]